MRFKRSCTRCDEMFRPTGKTQKICVKCIDKIQCNAIKKRKIRDEK